MDREVKRRRGEEKTEDWWRETRVNGRTWRQHNHSDGSIRHPTERG